MRRLAGASLLLVLVQFLGHAHASAQEPCLVKDIMPGSDEGNPMYLTTMGGLVFSRQMTASMAMRCRRAMAWGMELSWSKT
jgi:hypothetical protein